MMGLRGAAPGAGGPYGGGGGTGNVGGGPKFGGGGLGQVASHSHDCSLPHKNAAVRQGRDTGPLVCPSPQCLYFFT